MDGLGIQHMDAGTLKRSYSEGLHLKMDGWNTSVSFWEFAYFQVLLLLYSFTECIAADGSENPARKPVEVGS